MSKNLVTISNGNAKTGKSIPSVSIIPIKDCGNCECCRKDCYALKAWRMYKATRECWTHNSKAFRDNPLAAVNDISRQLARKHKLPRFFRIHVAGDFLNQDHVDAWSQLARTFPEIKFLAFTKMHSLNYRACPKNLKVYASMWPGLEDKAPTDMPRAWMQDGTEERVPEGALECPGNCETCGACFSLSQDVVFHKH